MTNRDRRDGSLSSFGLRHSFDIRPSTLVILKQIELRSILLRQRFLGFGRQEQFEAEALSEALCSFGRKSFEVITDKSPNVADLSQMALDFERPALQRGLAFPKKFVVSMNK